MGGSSSSGRVGATQVVLDSEEVRVVVDPARGGKIASILDRRSGREWLLQGSPGLPTPAHGSRFTDGPLAGWDEMLPTVDACTYPCEPFFGVALPDHGEVWTQRWDVEEASPATVACAVEGRALPYRLRRSLSVSGATLTAEYSLTVTAPQELFLLWTAHPQFVAERGTRLVLPAEVRELHSVVEGAERPRTPVVVPPNGLDCTGLAPDGLGMMLYADPAQPVSSVQLTHPDGSWLHMAWEGPSVPYFAVWLDNGLYADRPVVCPEPMSGYYDSLERAYHSDLLNAVAPDAPARWSVRTTLGTS